MRPLPRRSDDADVIRARLRALLDDGFRGGWVPEPDDADPPPWGAGEREAGDGAVDGIGVADGPVAPDASDGERPANVGRHRAPGTALRWDPGRRGARSLWIAGLLAALVVVAWTWLDRPRVEPLPAAPAGGSAAPVSSPPAPQVGEAAQTAGTVVVAVVGLVGRPGLVTLPSGSRVADAVEAAGGFLPGTDPAVVNLAAVVTDGQQIAVGLPGAGGASSPAAGADIGGNGSGALLNLNTATAADLDALPGIGPVLAQRIVDHRSEVGRFRSVDQLDDVPGIGPTIAAELAGLVTV